jgi:integrase
MVGELVGERDFVGITLPGRVPTEVAAVPLGATHADAAPAAADLAPADRPGAAPDAELPSARLARLARDAAAAVAWLPPAPEGTGIDLLPPATLSELTRVVDASLAPASKRAYRTDWRRFTTWATDHGYPALPAPPAVVAAYVTAAAAEQKPNGTFTYAPTSLTRWVSSINQAHAAVNLDPPGRSELVRRALSGIRRIRKAAPARRAPLLLDDIRGLVDWLGEVAGGWPAGVAARRDTALLLMGFAGAFRRGELAALAVGDVAAHRADGLHVRLRTSKTDQEAHGRTVALPYGRDPLTCPPCAWTRWRELLHAADTAPAEKRRAAVLRVLRRQAAHDHVIDTAGDDRGGAGDSGRLHVCRSTRLAEPADPARPLFPSVHGTGIVRDRAMSGDAVYEMIRRRAEQAGYTTTQIRQLGGHSLRAGFVTEAFRQGADAHAIMRQTGHRSHAVLETYAREHAPLVGNAVTRIAL